MERDDRANLFVLEGVLIALILLGAAYTVRSFQDPSIQEVRPRTELGRLTGDVLVVLEGMTDNGTSLLDLFLAEQYHCALDATPSSLDCHLRRSKNLSLKVENYLPLGAGWAVEVGNGAETRELYRSPLPQGEAVSATLAFGAEWNLTFITTELSCYDTATDINVTLVPIDRGVHPWTRWGNVTVGSTETPGIPAHVSKWWNATLPGATRPATGTVIANVTGNATLRGSTAYTSCDLHGKTAAIRDALWNTPFVASPAAIPVGTQASFSADTEELDDIDGVDVEAVSVSVYEPLPARNGTADSFILAGSATLTEGSEDEWSGTWLVPGHTLYAKHPVVMRATLDVDGTLVEARKVTTVDIALPSGEVPIDPPYRAILQTWLADWG